MKSERGIDTIGKLEKFVKDHSNSCQTHSAFHTKTSEIKSEVKVNDHKPVFFKPLRNPQEIALDTKSRELKGLRREISVLIKNTCGKNEFQKKWEEYYNKDTIDSFSTASLSEQADEIQKMIILHNKLASEIRTLLLCRTIKKYSHEDGERMFDAESEWVSVLKNGI